MSDTNSGTGTPDLTVAMAIPQPSEHKLSLPVQISIQASSGSREAETAAAGPLPTETQNELDVVRPGTADTKQDPVRDEQDTKPEDDESDAASVAGSTSTATFNHESFETFQNRVMALAQNSIWPRSTALDISVEQMTGGGYHRVVGLQKQPSSSSPDFGRYVLRIARSNQSAQELFSEAAAFRFAKGRISVPIPLITHICGSTTNGIESVWMVQERADGGPLHRIWDYLSHQQKCMLAQELGDAYRQMLAVQSTIPGTFFCDEAPTGHEMFRFDLMPLLARIRQEAEPDLELSDMVVPFSDAAPTTGTRVLLPELFGTHAELMEAKNEEVRAEISTEHEYIARGLEEGGWLDEVPNCLAHLDLEPRNIIADPGREKGEVITGILDWDSALLAPAFVACKPPKWLWEIWSPQDDISHYDENDETGANDEPPTAEARELKEIFERHAGPMYMRFAYRTAYRMARRLFRFITNGMTDNQDFKDSDDLLEEWKVFCDEGLNTQDC